ncbi:MAG: hypothetical protein ACLT38_00715 [Akkermansia sp.]
MVSYFRFPLRTQHFPAGRLDIEACPQNGADLTIGNIKKFRGGCSIDIDQSSTLTFNSYSGGNDGGRTTLDNYGTFNLAYTKSQGGERILRQFGSHGHHEPYFLNGSSYTPPRWQV